MDVKAGGAGVVGTLLYRADELRSYAERFLKHYGVPADDARVVADVLVTADERGIDSHGIARLYPYYGRRLERRSTDPGLSLIHI